MLPVLHSQRQSLFSAYANEHEGLVQNPRPVCFGHRDSSVYNSKTLSFRPLEKVNYVPLCSLNPFVGPAGERGQNRAVSKLTCKLEIN